MESMSDRYQMHYESSNISECLSSIIKHDDDDDIHSVENSSLVNEPKLMLWRMNKMFETTPQQDFKFSAIQISNSDRRSRQWMIIPSNVLGRLSGSARINEDCLLFLIISQECIYILPSRGIVENTCNFFRNLIYIKRILKLSEMLPMLDDIKCPLVVKDNEVIFSRSKSSLLYKEKLRELNGGNFDENSISSDSMDCSGEKLSCGHCISILKSRSVESNYIDDIIESHAQRCICSPIKKGIDGNPKQTGYATLTACNIFNEHKQFGEIDHSESSGYSERNHFQDDLHYVKGNCHSRHIEDKEDQSDNYENEENRESGSGSVDQELSGKRVRSKLAEIRKRVEYLSRGMNFELKRREQYHQDFIEQCEQICNFTMSFRDFNKIYSEEDTSQSTEVSLEESCDGISDDSFSEHGITNSSSHINFNIQASHQNRTSVACFHDLVDQSNFLYTFDQIPNQTGIMPFRDFREIYSEEDTLQSTEVSLKESCYEISENSFYEQDITNFSSHGNLSIQASHQNRTSVTCIHDLDQSNFSNTFHQTPNQNETSVLWNEGDNQIEDFTIRKQILKQSETILEKYPMAHLNRMLRNFPNNIAAVLRAISIPFVASIFGAIWDS